MYFWYFVIISISKRARLFIWTNFNPLHPGMLCAKLGWNWPSGSGEEDENEFLRQQQPRRRQRRRTTDKFWQILIRKAHLSLRLWWAKNTLFPFLNAIWNNTMQNITSGWTAPPCLKILLITQMKLVFVNYTTLIDNCINKYQCKK